MEPKSPTSDEVVLFYSLVTIFIDEEDTMTKKVVLFFVVAMVLATCGTPTLPCGDFTFSGTPHSNRGINMSLNFDFDPATCGAPACTCDTVAYVQIAVPLAASMA